MHGFKAAHGLKYCPHCGEPSIDYRVNTGIDKVLKLIQISIFISSTDALQSKVLNQSIITSLCSVYEVYLRVFYADIQSSYNKEPVAFHVSGYVMAAIKSENSLWVWDNNYDGAVGNGSRFYGYYDPKQNREIYAFVDTPRGTGRVWSLPIPDTDTVKDSVPKKVLDGVKLPYTTQPVQPTVPVELTVEPFTVENGITVGISGTTFSPDSICTCGQIMTFLYRAET